MDQWSATTSRWRLFCTLLIGLGHNHEQEGPVLWERPELKLGGWAAVLLGQVRAEDERGAAVLMDFAFQRQSNFRRHSL